VIVVIVIFTINFILKISALFKRILRNKIIIILIMFCVIALINSFLFYYFEVLIGPQKNLSYVHCFYWAIVTMATVGYGDIVPQTVEGYIVTALAIVLGISIFTLLISSLAEIFLNKSMRKYYGLIKVKNADIVVIGGTEICREVIDELKLNVKDSKMTWVLESQPRSVPEDIEFVVGNLNDEETLKRAGIEKADNIIICTFDDSLSIHLALLSKKLNKNAKITALAISKKTEELLNEINVNSIPLRIIGRTLASTVFEPSVAEFIEEATSAKGIVDLIEIDVDKNLVDKTLKEIIEVFKDKKKYKIRPLMIVRKEYNTIKRIPVTDEEIKISKEDKIVALKIKEQTKQ